MIRVLLDAQAVNPLILPVLVIGVAVVVLAVAFLLSQRANNKLKTQLSLELQEFVEAYQSRAASLGERLDVLAASQDEVETHVHERIDELAAKERSEWEAEVDRKLNILGKSVQAIGVRR